MTAKPRFDWFQTDSLVSVVILKKGVVLDSCHATVQDTVLRVSVSDEVIFESKLFGDVVNEDMTVTCTAAKVEVKLPKRVLGRWPQLVAVSSDDPSSSFMPVATIAPLQTTSSYDAPPPPLTKKNWDAIEKQAVAEEENEELEGDAAVNRMFKKLYGDASDDVRKAMLKSYTESGGTVLSTNWNDISQKKTEVKPPDCMEYKSWDH